MQGIAQHHGIEMAQVVAPRILNSPQHLKSIMLAAKKYGKSVSYNPEREANHSELS